MTKSKQTKAHEIPIKVKQVVAERDSVDGFPCCIYCGKPAPTENRLGFSNAHIVKRSQGGMGIETNIVTLCPFCHHQFDDTTDRDKMMNFIVKYMKQQHGRRWCLGDQIYRK